MRHAGLDLPGFRHEALLYDDDHELISGTVPGIRETLDAEAAVLVALPRPSERVVRDALGTAADDVAWLDMEALGRNPGRIIPAWRKFVGAHADDPVAPFGIGEPLWPGRSGNELLECARHETLLNLAFSPGPDWRLLCPYDASRLAPEAVERARRSHPNVIEHGSAAPSDAFAREIPADDPLPEPAEVPDELPLTGNLGLVREFVTQRARRAGMPLARVSDVVLAVDELATNSIRYAGGRGVVRSWVEEDALLFEVEDQGHIADPLAGRELPPAQAVGGRGLYLVNQLCDLVQLRSSPGRSVVRVSVVLS
jgi:anti-sigma regulatory factor (Ser/Thr protein kinase)